MSKQNNSFWDSMRKLFHGRPVINNPRYPKSWQPQTDYNPVAPGSEKPEKIDMRPKAVAQREKEARRALIWPVAAVVGVVLVFVAAILIKKFS